jgi:hypothetical protein
MESQRNNGMDTAGDTAPIERRVALHEAGHAVIATKLKSRPSHVELAQFGSVFPGPSDCFGRVVLKRRPIQAYRLGKGDTFTLAKPIHERLPEVRRWIIILLAGKWAENDILGGYYPDSFADDEKSIAKVLAAFPSTEETKAELLKKYERETDYLVMVNTHAIEAVAKALLKHRKLTGREVGLIIETVEGS